MTALLASLILSYLIGSFPTSIIVGRVVARIDIRDHGSGNAGMTNVFRILGFKPALVVGSIDVFKGWFATTYTPVLLQMGGLVSDEILGQILAGCAVILGHTYTVLAGFRGGKGVATMVGVLLAVYPPAVPFCLAGFAAAVVAGGYVSVGSMVAGIMLPIAVLVLPLLGFQETKPSLNIFSVIVALFILYTHRGNISRLQNGTENRFEKMMIFRSRGKDNEAT